MPIIFDDRFPAVTASDRLTYLDAGARGGLQGPWREADDGRLRVISFEPDRAGTADLQRDDRRDHVVVAKGLWSTPCELDLHLAEIASTSSIHPPNFQLLERFRRQHAEPRRTVRKVRVECTTVDVATRELSVAIDFMKLDTQGAEFEILEGAKNQLRQNVFAVLCETWTQPVHRGQRLTHEVWAFLESMGFEIVQVSVAAAWQHRLVDSMPLSGRAHLTGLDLLALRKPDRWAAVSVARAVKWAAIAELYGYPDIAIELLDAAITAAENERQIVAYFRNRVQQSATAEPTVAAKLHY